ncbi:MAG: hypothetical protein WA738_10685 [Candidatus Angelobacter sp.]
MPVLLLAMLAVVYAVIAVLDPWSLHIGGRWTPLLTWRGSGKLVTKSGIDYPLYVSFYPSPHFSRLHLDGLRPTGGLQGSAWLCTSPGVSERLRLSGTIYGGWRSTDDSLMAFRLLESRIINVGQRQGFFDLYGRWRGPTLVMNDRERVSGTFGSGLRIDHASVSLDWGSYSDFKAACASATNLPTRR